MIIMKGIRDFIYEQLNENKVSETVVKDNNGKKIIIVGKPFTTDRDENYIAAVEYLKQNNIRLDIDLKGMYKAMRGNASDVENWVIVKNGKFARIINADDLELPQELFEARDNVSVYAVVDFTDAIQGVYTNKADAEEAARDLPEEAQAKVKRLPKSEVEK